MNHDAQKHDNSLATLLFERYFKTLSYRGFIVEIGRQDEAEPRVLSWFRDKHGWQGIRVSLPEISLRELVTTRHLTEIDLMVIGLGDERLSAIAGMSQAACHPRVLCVAGMNEVGHRHGALEAMGYSFDSRFDHYGIWLKTGLERTQRHHAD